MHKNTNDFLKILRSLTSLPNDIILCSVDVADLYPNILHEQSLCALQKRLELRRERNVSTTTLVELVEVVLKNNVFTLKNFDKINCKRNRSRN